MVKLTDAFVPVIFPVWFLITYITVSYTHLDVYKRQHTHSTYNDYNKSVCCSYSQNLGPILNTASDYSFQQVVVSWWNANCFAPDHKVSDSD